MTTDDHSSPDTGPGSTAGAKSGSTTADPRVAVRGEARLEVDPEIARITVTVTARGRDRRTALDDLTQRNNTALQLIKSYGEAVEKLETGNFAISPQLTDKGKNERVRAYQGRVLITAELGDFTALGELTTRLADLELTRVDGPYWALRPDSPVHAQARRQAVHEAVHRAREYADALGSHLTSLIDIADIGANNGALPPPPPPPGAMRAVSYGAPEMAGAPALDLEPQRQTVYANLNARFTMAPPEL
ncbi:SIMPL domain-containing protein [Streptomyces sp. Da 82-17]|uniref:SIMPL domain-containing protein n=1 Tax=Streptomyces sp. Da 82-17 TaxID=3377116 RepID=UPI0038D3964A